MKRTVLASITLFALLSSGGPVHAADADRSGLTFECAAMRLPAMSAVSAVTGIDNFSAAYAEREKLLHQAERLCRNPAVAIVRFVPDAQVAVEPLRSVAAR